MPDYDVKMEYTIPDLDRDGAEELLEDVASYIIDRTGWTVASHIAEAKPEPDGKD